MINEFETERLYKSVLLLKDKERDEIISEELMQMELNWNFSDFISRLLLYSKLEWKFTPDFIKTEIDKFNLKNTTNVSFDLLRDKQWVRVVLNEIEISDAIDSVIYNFPQKTELKEKYRNESFWNDLCFLSEIKMKYGYKDSRKWLVEKKYYNQLCILFSQMYEDCFSKERINKLLKISDWNDIFFSFEISSIGFNFIANKIASKIWNELIKLETTNICEDKLLLWIEKTHSWFHSQNFLSNLSKREKDIFVNSAISVLLNEKDIMVDDIEIEKLKILLDAPHWGNNLPESILFPNTSIINFDNSSFFLLGEKINANYQREMIGQHSRESLLYIIYMLFSDKSISNFGSIEILLKNSLNRPYIFEIVLSYFSNFPEIAIRFLDGEYALPILISIIKNAFSKLNMPMYLFKENIPSMINDLMLLYIKKRFQRIKYDVQELSDFLITIAKNYFTPDFRDYYKKEKQKILDMVLSNTDSILGNLISGKIGILIELYKKDFSILLANNNSSLNTISLGYLFLLVKLTNNIGQQKVIFEQISYIYLNDFIKQNKNIYIFDTEEIVQFDWYRLYWYFLNDGKNREFITIINPLFQIEYKQDDFDLKYNNCMKIRIHILILSSIYQNTEFFLSLSPDVQQNYEYEFAYILLNCFNDTRTTLNVFKDFYEMGIDDKNTEIFPIVLKCIEQFSTENKKRVLSKLCKTTEIRLIFKTLNLLNKEEDKEFIKELINIRNFEKEIENINYVPTYFDVLRDVINSNFDEDLSWKIYNKLREIVENKIEKLVKEAVQLEQMHLFLLYSVANRDAIKNYVYPFAENFENKELLKDLYAYKLFYQALDDLDMGRIESGYELFQQLVKQFPENIEFKIQKLCAEYEYNYENGKNSEYLLLQLDEIKEYIKQKAPIYIGTIYSLKSNIFCDNEIVEEENNLWHLLPLEYKKEICFAKNHIKLCIGNGRFNEAWQTLNNITEQGTLEFSNLKKSIPMDEKIAELKESYKDILSCLIDEERFKVLPQAISQHSNNLGEYILNEIIYVANNILKKIVMVREICKADENIITDLFEIVLNARLSMLKYNCSSQNRGGVSSTKKDAGELDLSIPIDNKTIVLEAVRYSTAGMSGVKEHINKIFGYNHTRDFLFDIIYYQTNPNGFINFSENLQDELKKITYPDGYDILKCEGLDNFGGGIKVIRAKHKNNLVFYHIIINFSSIGIELIKKNQNKEMS